MLCSPGVSALQRQLCFAAPETVLCSQGLCSAAPGEDKGEEFALWGTRLCFVAPGGCASAPGERGLCFGAPGSALQHQWGWGGTGWLCFAAPGEGRGEGFVLWSTRLSFCSTRKDGGEERRGFAPGEGRGEGFVLCSTREDGRIGERTGACALEYKVLCSMRGDGGEQGVCALQH